MNIGVAFKGPQERNDQNDGCFKADQCTSNIGTQVVSIDMIAATTHERWRKTEDRGCSWLNKPWHELSPQDRFRISRDTRNVIDQVLIGAPGAFLFVDEYVPPGPGDARWNDPAR